MDKLYLSVTIHMNLLSSSEVCPSGGAVYYAVQHGSNLISVTVQMKKYSPLMLFFKQIKSVCVQGGGVHFYPRESVSMVKWHTQGCLVT